MHRRTAIRDAIVAELLAGLPGGTLVTAGLIYPVGAGELPLVNVRTGNENELDETRAATAVPPQLQIRELQILIELWVDGEGDVDAAADALALETERALGDVTDLGGLVDQLRYEGSGEPEREGTLEVPVVARELAYQVFYQIDPRNPV